MRNEWKEVTLDKVYEFRSGLSKPRSEFGSGYKFLSFKDVFYNYFVPDELTELVNSTGAERENCSVKRGDVFLTRTSETFDELGMSSVALRDYENATFNGFCKRLRPIDNSVIVPEYAGYYFRSLRFRRSVTAMSSMSTRANLNNEILGKLKIVIPSKEEQKKIGFILKAFDDKIALNRRQNDTLEHIAQALFQSWFVDFDPVIDKALAAGKPIPEPLQARAARREAMGDRRKPLPAEIQALFPDGFGFDEELGWVPEGWRVGRVEELANVIGGGTPSKKVPEYFSENGIAWLTPKDLSGYQWKFISRGATDISLLGLKKSSAKLMPRGTVLFSSRAPIGYIAIAENEIATNQGFKSLVPKKAVPSEYLFYFLKSNIDRVESFATGSTFKEVSGSAIKALFILIPSKEILNRYEKETTPFNERRLSIQKESEYLTQLRDTLLPKLISGELRLPEAEKVLKDVL